MTNVEATLAKNLSHNIQGTLSVTHQWHSIEGTWGPTDPARFIQPEAFENNHDLSQYLFGNGDTNTLSGGGRESGVAYRPYSVRLAGRYLAPYKFQIGVSYVIQAGGWVGPVLAQLTANDPRVTVFGPALVTLADGTTQSNPLALTLRYCGAAALPCAANPVRQRRTDAQRGRAVHAAAHQPRVRSRRDAPRRHRRQHLQPAEQRCDDAVEHRRQPALLAELPVTIQPHEFTSGAVQLQIPLLNQLAGGPLWAALVTGPRRGKHSRHEKPNTAAGRRDRHETRVAHDRRRSADWCRSRRAGPTCPTRPRGV
jgi:hypothetical protein